MKLPCSLVRCLVSAFLCASLASLLVVAGCKPATPTGGSSGTGQVQPPPQVPPTPVTTPTPPPAPPAPKPAPSGGASHAGVWTPAIGSPERVAMMNSLRDYLKRQDLVFVVPWLKAKGGWAFAQVSPQTKNGKEHLEGLDVLFAGTGDAWAVKAVMGLNGEDDWLKYETAHGIRAYWTKTYPSSPPGIYPK